MVSKGTTTSRPSASAENHWTATVQKPRPLSHWNTPPAPAAPTAGAISPAASMKTKRVRVWVRSKAASRSQARMIHPASTTSRVSQTVIASPTSDSEPSSWLAPTIPISVAMTGTGHSRRGRRRMTASVSAFVTHQNEMRPTERDSSMHTTEMASVATTRVAPSAIVDRPAPSGPSLRGPPSAPFESSKVCPDIVATRSGRVCNRGATKRTYHQRSRFEQVDARPRGICRIYRPTSIHTATDDPPCFPIRNGPRAHRHATGRASGTTKKARQTPGLLR